MNNKKEPMITAPTNSSQALTLHLIISNGDPRTDARLTFEFKPQSPDQTQLWVLGLPQLTNPDAFPRQIAPDTWEMQLDAVAQTKPIEIFNYTRENAHELMERFYKPQGGAPAELLILALANDRKFTISLTEFYGGSR